MIYIELYTKDGKLAFRDLREDEPKSYGDLSKGHEGILIINDDNEAESLINYHEKFDNEQEELERIEAEERRYGSYESQVRGTYQRGVL